MDKVVFFLTFMILSLLGKGTMIDSSSEFSESMDSEVSTNVFALQKNDRCFFIVPSHEIGNIVSVKSESIVNQLNIRTERLVRHLFFQYRHQLKEMMRKLNYCTEQLAHHSSHWFTSFQSLCWTYASEHYVFALRRLLI